MNSQTLELLFSQYRNAFATGDVATLANNYQLPCTLSTPDNIMVVDCQQQLESVLASILQQLAQADVCDIKVLQASCTSVTDNIVLACIDWAFIDSARQVFADFSAFYHLVKLDHQYKIISVSSQELSQSASLAEPLHII